MKTIKHTVISLSILLALSACRKEVKEPQKASSKQEYTYVQIDDSKFLVNDKRINFNKNMKGYNSLYVTVSDIETKYVNSFENTDLEESSFKGDINVAFPTGTGIITPRYLRFYIRARPKGRESMYVFSGALENYGNPDGFKDYKFTVLSIDTETKEMEFKIECSAMDKQDSTYHKLYIKSKTKIN